MFGTGLARTRGFAFSGYVLLACIGVTAVSGNRRASSERGRHTRKLRSA
jgi:hypothetical protein